MLSNTTARIRSGILLPVILLLAAILFWTAVPAQDVGDEEMDDTPVLDETTVPPPERQQETQTMEETPTIPTTMDEGLLPRFEDVYSVPTTQIIYDQWLASGALGLIVPIENEIRRRQLEFAKTVTSRQWSAALQRDLDMIEDTIDRLEEERSQTLLERIAQVELRAGLSSNDKARAALLYMALALTDMDEGKAKLAVESLERAGDFLPDEPLVHALHAIALRECGQNNPARQELRETLAVQPGMLLTLMTLAQVYEDDLNFQEAAEMWRRASLARTDYPESTGRLSAVPSDRIVLRLRLARLNAFAQNYYQAENRSGYRLVYDPSLGLPAREGYLTPLRELVGLYLDGGERAADPADLEKLLRAMTRDRDPSLFRQLMGQVSSSLETAADDISDAIHFRRGQRPIVVIHNPDIWETLIANRETLGLYSPHGRIISIYVSPRMNPGDLRYTVYHEYAHFATFDITGPRSLPVWLVEGLAEYLARESGYDRFAESGVLAKWREVWSNIRIERPWFNKTHEEFTVTDYYKARQAIDVLARSFGVNGLFRFLQTLGEGTDLNEASRRAFNMDYRDLMEFIIRRPASWTGG